MKLPKMKKIPGSICMRPENGDPELFYSSRYDVLLFGEDETRCFVIVTRVYEGLGSEFSKIEIYQKANYKAEILDQSAPEPKAEKVNSVSRRILDALVTGHI